MFVTMSGGLLDHWSALILLAGLIVWTIRLSIAYRLYLRFDHPFATVFASQVIVLLIAVNVAALQLWR